MILHNRINKEELKERMRQNPEERITLSFYRYLRLTDPREYRDQLYLDLSDLEVMGRIYLAHEGINAQIDLPLQRLEEFQDFIDLSPTLRGIRLNLAIEQGNSFYKLKILVRRKIVADGLNDDTFDVTQRGQHLSAKEFNVLTEDPDTILVDMRNHYESEVGHFENAICPDVDTFREALPLVEDLLENKKDKNIIMYCTGGIRCEKASAYYRHRGFTKVYQLEGGIIEYARQVQKKNLPNKFRGKNFVFDERLGERISNDIISICHQCGQPADTHTNCHNMACHLLFIQCEKCAEKLDGCCSEECQDVAKLPADEQRKRRKGTQKGRQVYRKGRSAKLLFKK